MNLEAAVGLSNKHAHLTQKDIETLFGEGHQLTVMKPLLQIGEYASEEKIDIVGPKGTIKGIRVLGPARAESQIELSITDARGIGIKAPIRESGKLEGSAGCVIVGPAGKVELEKGVIIASRHIHISTADAAEMGLKNGDYVSVKCDGIRAITFDNVLVRTRDNFIRELHLDTDEGNAAGIGPDAKCTIILKQDPK